MIEIIEVIEVIVNFLILLTCMWLSIQIKKNPIFIGAVFSILNLIKELTYMVISQDIRLVSAIVKINLSYLILGFLFFSLIFWLLKEENSSWLSIVLGLFWWAISPIV